MHGVAALQVSANRAPAPGARAGEPLIQLAASWRPAQGEREVARDQLRPVLGADAGGASGGGFEARLETREVACALVWHDRADRAQAVEVDPAQLEASRSAREEQVRGLQVAMAKTGGVQTVE